MFSRTTRSMGTKVTTPPAAKSGPVDIKKRGILYTKIQADPQLQKIMQNNHLYTPKDQKELRKLRKLIDQTNSSISQLDNKAFKEYLQFNSKKNPDNIFNLSNRIATQKHKQNLLEDLLVSGDLTINTPAQMRKVKMAVYSNSSHTPERIQTLTENIVFAKGTHTEDSSHIFDSDASDLNKLEKTNAKKAKKHNQFLADVEHIISNRKHSENQQTIKDLESFIYDREGGIGRFHPEELNRLMVHFWNLNAADSIMEMVMESKNVDFKQDILTLELFAKSALLSPSYYNPFIAICAANIMLKIEPDNYEAFSILGLAHESRNDCAKKVLDGFLKKTHDTNSSRDYRIAFPSEELSTPEIVQKNYENTLALSTYFYEKAFELSLDSRYGARLMHRQLTQNNHAGAATTADFIQMSCLRDEVYQSENLSIVKNYLEAAYVKQIYNRNLKWMEAKLLTLCTTQKQTINTLHAFKQIHKVLGDEASEKMVHRLEKHIDELAENRPKALADRKKELSKITLPTNEESWKWHQKTYSYAGLTSNVIEGSLKTFGGQLPAHEVNRYTKKFFHSLLKVPIGELISKLPPKVDPNTKLIDLDPQTDIDLFLDLTDTFLREQFKTDQWNLENITSDGHKKFDKIVNGTIKLAGIPEDPSERKKIKQDQTNLAMILYSRLGDCRQHAQSKQLLFDTWKEVKSNYAILKMKKLQEEEKDAENLIQQRKDFYDMLAHKLKLWDMEVGYYDSNNNYVKIEEHSANLKLVSDYDGNLSEVAISDAFYQATYDFKNRVLDFHGKLPDNNTFYEAGTFNVKGVPYRLVVKSANYAGPKDKHDKSSNQNHYAGLPDKPVSVDEMIKDRHAIDDRHDLIHKWQIEQL